MSDYIATAKVRAVPDMAGFRAALLAGIRQSTSGVAVKVPVQVQTEGAAAAQRVQRDIQRSTSAAQQQIAAQAAATTRQQEQQALATARAAASEQRTLAQRRAATATLTRQIEAQVAATEHDLLTVRNAAGVRQFERRVIEQERLAREALTAATIRGNAAEQARLRTLLQGLAVQRQIDIRAAATGIEALSAQQAAAAKSASDFAARQRFLARGAGASLLTLVGLRGATLAANSAFLAGTAAVVGFAKSIQLASRLETNLAVFAATAGATSDQLERASDLAVQLGSDITLPAVGADDAASAFTNLAKAGLSVEDSLDGARGVLQLATAAEIENAEATELVASALNSFGLAGTEAIRVADLLTGAANESQGSISDMGIALQQSSAAARQAGLTVEDTVAILTLLARNGLRGSDAGTSLRTALLRLIRPSEQAREVLGRLSANIRDAQGNVRPEVFADLVTALEGSSRAQRDFALATIFGADAFRAASILGRESVAGLNEIRAATQEQGLAAELAAARTAGFAGKLEALKNDLGILGTAFGEFAIGPTGAVVDTLREVTQVVTDLTEQLDRLEQSVPGGGFLDNLFGDIPLTGGEFIREFRSAIELTKRGEFGDISSPFETATNIVERFNRELLSSVDTTQELAALLGEAKGPQDAVETIRNLSSELIGSSKDVQELRDQLVGVERLVVALGRAPTRIELEVFLERGFVDEATIRAETEKLRREMRDTGKIAGDALVESLSSSLDPKLFNTLGFGIVTGIQEGIDRSPPIDLEGIGLTAPQIEAQLAGFEARGVRAEIAGDVSARLEELRKQQEFLRSQIERAAKAGRTTLRVDLERDLLQVQNEIQGILDGIAAEQERRQREAERRADEARQAQERAHRAIVDAFNLRISRQQNAILRAQATAWLADDLKTTRDLRRIIREAIASGKLRADELADFRRQLLQADEAIRSIVDDINARRREGIELDISFAQTQENIGAEIRARQRLIRKLKEAQREEKKGTLEWKRLRNEIAEQRAAIKDLRKEEQGRVGDLSALAFEFLRTQQGFAANLLSNLIPLGASGGLVGNVSPAVAAAQAATGRAAFPEGQPRIGLPGGPGQALSREAQITAGRDSGLSRGLQEAEVSISRQMLRVLREIQRGQGFPESNHQRKTAGAAMDTL